MFDALACNAVVNLEVWFTQVVAQFTTQVVVGSKIKRGAVANGLCG